MADKEVLDSKLSVLKLDQQLAKLKKKTGLIVQSLLFAKDKFTAAEAKKWALSHKDSSGENFKAGDIHITANYIRFRQKEQDDFHTFKTVTFADGIKAIVASNTSRFAAFLHVKDISKFSDKIKNDMDLKLPLKAEIQILSVGKTRDGRINRQDLEESLEGWINIPIIDFHDESEEEPTVHRPGDRKGYTIGEPFLSEINGVEWITIPAYITDRAMAYQLYVKQKLGKPLEVSAEFGRNKYAVNGEIFLHNITPHMIVITDKGHVQGNKITVAA